jgi:hypothetical protein
MIESLHFAGTTQLTSTTMMIRMKGNKERKGARETTRPKRIEPK